MCDQEKVFVQRIRSGVGVLGPAFRFGKLRIGRNPRDRRLVFLAFARIDNDDRTGRVAMMRHGRGDDLVRAGNGPRFAGRTWISCIIAVHVCRGRAIGPGDPQALEERIVAIDVIPSRVDDPPVVQETGLPLGGFAKGDTADVRAVAVGTVQHKVGEVAVTVLAPHV